MVAREQIRLLSIDDIRLVERLLHSSEYIYQRFTLEELPEQLKHYPAVGAFSGTSLYGFLLSQVLSTPCAWIGGFGVSWTESTKYVGILYQLLEQLSAQLILSGVRYLHYSGNDAAHDWLRSILLARGFVPYRQLYSYDKYDFTMPTIGNQQVTVRPVRLTGNMLSGVDDMSALLNVEAACFEDLWRYDGVAFRDIAATHPYFVVAELNGRVVGYQFNTVDANAGYLIRIAVHPSVNGQGIGARLMAEALHFFAQKRVTHIMLNTQETNTHAHRLYEWFGFERIQQMGFVLRKSL
jgi:[ribosomal protein S18]-alanine N-acetyltransferase